METKNDKFEEKYFAHSQKELFKSENLRKPKTSFTHKVQSFLNNIFGLWMVLTIILGFILSMFFRYVKPVYSLRSNSSFTSNDKHLSENIKTLNIQIDSMLDYFYLLFEEANNTISPSNQSNDNFTHKFRSISITCLQINENLKKLRYTQGSDIFNDNLSKSHANILELIKKVNAVNFNMNRSGNIKLETGNMENLNAEKKILLQLLIDLDIKINCLSMYINKKS